jgi:D-tyrosyl-tRNA(Tyr) deacylase
MRDPTGFENLSGLWRSRTPPYTLMRAVLQRVSSGRVIVNNQNVAEIGRGLVILLGIGPADTQEQARFLADKIAHLRIFEDEQGKMNLSVQEVGGQVIVVSQFTLYADTRKGRRPSFTDAASPDIARPLVDFFAQHLINLGVPTQTGEFGAHMLVEIHNDGPVTIIFETDSP